MPDLPMRRRTSWWRFAGYKKNPIRRWLCSLFICVGLLITVVHVVRDPPDIAGVVIGSLFSLGYPHLRGRPQLGRPVCHLKFPLFLSPPCRHLPTCYFSTLASAHYYIPLPRMIVSASKWAASLLSSRVTFYFNKRLARIVRRRRSKKA